MSEEPLRQMPPDHHNHDMVPATDAELDAIYEQFDWWVVPRRATWGHLHMSADGKQSLCDEWNSPTIRGGWKPKPISTYPKGFRDVCKNCLKLWREAQADG